MNEMEMSIMKVYGIKNCDMVKKVCKFFEEVGVDYVFYDYKKDGVDVDRLEGFVGEFGWEVVLNWWGIIWCWFDEVIWDGVIDVKSVFEVMIDNFFIIKCLIVEGVVKNFIGFDVVVWEMVFEFGEFK